MGFRTLMIIKAVVCVILGPLLVLIPGPFGSIFGLTLAGGGAMLAREYGAALVGLFLLTWFARNTAESDARWAIILALFVYDAVGFVVTLQAGLAGGYNPLGWSIPLLYLFFTVGFGYLAIRRSGAPRGAVRTA